MAQHGSQSASPCAYNDFSSNDTMNLTFKQIDCLLSLIEFHDDWDEVSELMGTDVSELYDILTELRDAAN